MSATDTNERTERRNALDEFASAPAREIMPSPSVLPMASPGDRVFGAQAVAVYRDEARILQKLAALGAAAGDDWFYRFPVKNKQKGTTDFIEGASIKLANDVARIYGNCEVDTRVIDLGSSWLIYARFTDFESGYALTRPFQQNKNASKMGGSDNDRRLDIAFQIGVSKAIRNVVVNALQTYSDYAFDAARNSLVERIGKNVQGYRERTVTGISNLGVELARVELVVGRPSKDWTAPDIAKVLAMMKAIADGMATIDETFPPKGGQASEQDAGETEQSNSAASSSETGEPSTAGASGAGQADPNKDPDKAGPADNSVSSQKGAGTHASDASGRAASESTSSKVKDKGAAEAGEGKVEQPKTEAEYVAFANAWIEALTDADVGEKRWPHEKNLRNKANVGAEAREALQTKLAQKCREIRDADKS
jgi:hypothetical protein